MKSGNLVSIALLATACAAADFGSSFTGIHFTTPPFGYNVPVVYPEDVVGNTNRSIRIDNVAGMSMLSVFDGVMDRQILPASTDHMRDSYSIYEYDHQTVRFTSEDLSTVDWHGNRSDYTTVYTNYALIGYMDVMLPLPTNRNAAAELRAGRISKWLADNLRRSLACICGMASTSNYHAFVHGSSALGGKDWFEYDECSWEDACHAVVNQMNEDGVWKTLAEVPCLTTQRDYPCMCYDVVRNFNPAFVLWDKEEAVRLVERMRNRTLVSLVDMISEFPCNVDTNTFPPKVGVRIDALPWGEAAAALTLIDKTYHDYGDGFAPKAEITEMYTSDEYYLIFECDASIGEVVVSNDIFGIERTFATISAGAHERTIDSDVESFTNVFASLYGMQNIECLVNGGEVLNDISATFERKTSLYARIDSTVSENHVPDGKYEVRFHEFQDSGLWFLTVSIGQWSSEFSSESRFLPRGISAGDQGSMSFSISVESILKSVPSVFANVLSLDEDVQGYGNVPFRNPAQRFVDYVESVCLQHACHYYFNCYAEDIDEYSYMAEGMKCAFISANEECRKMATRNINRIVGFVNDKAGGRLKIDAFAHQKALAEDAIGAGKDFMSHDLHWMHEQYVQVVSKVEVSGGTITLYDSSGNVIVDKTSDGLPVTHKDIYIASESIERDPGVNASAEISFPYVINWNFGAFRKPRH